MYFHVGLGTKALTDRLCFLSQIAGWTSLNPRVPATGSFGRAWQRLDSAKALQAPSQGFADAAPFSSRVALDRLFFVKCFEVWLCQSLVSDNYVCLSKTSEFVTMELSIFQDN